MKCSFFILFILAALNLDAQTPAEVITRFTDANGGNDRLAAINSYVMKSRSQMQRFGNVEITTTQFREQGKLFRLQAANSMSEDQSFTLVTDTAGYTFTPAMPQFGSNAQLNKIDTAELKEMNYLMDCAGAFAELVNFAAKGHTATLKGKEKVNGFDCDIVNLKLANGQQINYFIAENGQVKRMQVAASTAMQMMGMGGMRRMMGGGNNGGGNRRGGGDFNRLIDIEYDKYKLFNGFPFPTKIIYKLGMFEMEVEVVSVEVNKPIDPRWYEAN
jgi:hypothetical protein